MQQNCDGLEHGRGNAFVFLNRKLIWNWEQKKKVREKEALENTFQF